MRFTFRTFTIIGLALLMALGFTASAVAQSKVTIEFFEMKQEPVQLFKDQIAKFTAENPGITVNLNNVPNAQAVLQTRMASNDVPDVYTHYPELPDFVEQAKSGFAMDLTGQKFLSSVVPAFLDISRINGKVYAVPIALNFMGVYYNPKMFKDLGIAVPQTWDQMIAAAKKIKAAGKVAFEFADKDQWTVGQASTNLYVLDIPSYAQFFNDLAAGKTTAEKSADLRKVAQRMMELRTYGQEDTVGTDYNSAIADFATGKAAMFHQGNWALASLTKANPNLEFAMFPFPADAAGATKVMGGIDLAYVVSAKTKNKDAALKFVDFLTRTANVQAYIDMSAAPPCVKGVMVKNKEFATMMSYVSAGKFVSWPQFKWAAGMEVTNMKTTQGLAASNDIDAYLQEMTRTFVEGAQK